METFSKEYGWTPKEIREQSVEDLIQYFQIMRLRKNIENKKIKKMKNNA